jgi:hypothetical protein
MTVKCFTTIQKLTTAFLILKLTTMHLTKFPVTTVVSFLTQLIESSDSYPRSNGFYAHFLCYQI